MCKLFELEYETFFLPQSAEHPIKVCIYDDVEEGVVKVFDTDKSYDISEELLTEIRDKIKLSGLLDDPDTDEEDFNKLCELGGYIMDGCNHKVYISDGRKSLKYDLQNAPIYEEYYNQISSFSKKYNLMCDILDILEENGIDVSTMNETLVADKQD